MQELWEERDGEVKAMATGHCRVLSCGESRSEMTDGQSRPIRRQLQDY